MYCTVNIENKKIYVGIHKTDNPDTFDGYIGCGVKINQPSSYMNPTTPFQFAVKKYGCNKFQRITLIDNLTKEEALKMEAAIVNENFIKRADTYNASLGGNGGKLGHVVYQFNFKGELIKK